MHLLAALLLLAAPVPKPNIVFILADDLGWGDVSFNGRKDWKTPNLDRLASEGTVFTRWYTAATVCAPSRAALMTGKYTIHNGVSANNADLPASAVTVASALKGQGYATALFGKWHHGRVRPGAKTFRHPLDLGFDEMFGFLDARHAWEHFPRELFDGRRKVPVKGWSDSQFADKSIDFIARHKTKPFFLYLSSNVPHFHVEALPADLKEQEGKFKERDPKNAINAKYAAMIVRLDKEVGRVLKALDDHKLADKTLVVFTSDHGATFETGNKGAAAYHDSNRPFRGQKRTLWEGGIRVPAVVRWPGQVPAGKKSAELVHMTDMFPTLLAAAGGSPKKEWNVDGIDLGEVWRGKAKGPDRTLFWEWRVEGYHQLAAMRGDKKYVVTGLHNPPELFDVEKDPAERRNVITLHRPLADRLKKELAAWMATETEASKEGLMPPRKSRPSAPGSRPKGAAR